MEIVLLERDTMWARALCRVLREHRVRHAATAEEALRMVDEGPVDVFACRDDWQIDVSGILAAVARRQPAVRRVVWIVDPAARTFERNGLADLALDLAAPERLSVLAPASAATT